MIIIFFPALILILVLVRLIGGEQARNNAIWVMLAVAAVAQLAVSIYNQAKARREKRSETTQAAWSREDAGREGE